jgi:hypothetical protein
VKTVVARPATLRAIDAFGAETDARRTETDAHRAAIAPFRAEIERIGAAIDDIRAGIDALPGRTSMENRKASMPAPWESSATRRASVEIKRGNATARHTPAPPRRRSAARTPRSPPHPSSCHPLTRPAAPPASACLPPRRRPQRRAAAISRAIEVDISARDRKFRPHHAPEMPRALR